MHFSRYIKNKLISSCGVMDSIPDATTVAFFRERLRKAGLIEVIFEHFEQYLCDGGYEARGGQIIDATLVPVP